MFSFLLALWAPMLPLLLHPIRVSAAVNGNRATTLTEAHQRRPIWCSHDIGTLNQRGQV